MKLSTLYKGCAAICAIFLAGTSAFAQSVTEGFDNVTSINALPDGWDVVNTKGNLAVTTKNDGIYHSAKLSLVVAYDNTTDYLVTPMLEGEFSFWVRNYNKNYQAFITAYACKYDNGSLELDSQIDTRTLTKTSSPQWTQVTFKSEIPTRVALLISRAYFDDFTYSPASAIEGPSLTITDFENGSDFDFGTVKAGTEKTFNLVNRGGEDLLISDISLSGGFTFVSGSDIKSLPGGSSASLVVATPANDADGCLTITSNSTEPIYTINLKSTYKIPAAIMNVNPTKIDFGKVKADTSAQISVSNTGDATLEVEITSDNDSFETDRSSITVEPGNTENFTLTYKFDSTYFGINTVQISLKPNYGETIIVEATAVSKDPSLWEEDFEEGRLPEGWSTTGWEVTKTSFYGSNGTYMAYAGTSSNNYVLVTPRLYANEGEELTFEIGGGIDSSDKLTVEYSNDQKEWTPVEGSDFTSTGFKTFQAPASGNYYLRFIGKYGAVDNFSGFRLDMKEHDLSITSQSIPASGYQYLEYTATASVTELLGNTETANVTLLVDGVPAATEKVEIEAKATANVSLSFLPETAMENVEIRFGISYADGEEILGDAVRVNIAAAPVWSEDEDSELAEGTLPVVVFNYNPTEGWNTIAVPFALNDDHLTAIFGESYQVYELKAFDIDSNTISFQEATIFNGGYAAGYPYVVFVKGASEEPTPEVRGVENEEDTTPGIILKDVKIQTINPQEEVKNGVRFFSVFSPEETAEEANTYTIDAEKHSLVAVTSLKGYHAYITLPASVNGVPTVKFYDGNGVETGIGSIEMETILPRGIFDLNGRKVKEPLRPGIYIINGKKQVIL